MPSIHDLIEAVRDARQHEPNTVISLTLRSDSEKWAQLLPEKVNLCYPFDQPPSDLIRALKLPHADLAIAGFWEANLFADFDTSAMTVDQLSCFLHAYLAEAFKIGEY